MYNVSPDRTDKLHARALRNVQLVFTVRANIRARLSGAGPLLPTEIAVFNVRGRAIGDSIRIHVQTCHSSSSSESRASINAPSSTPLRE